MLYTTTPATTTIASAGAAVLVANTWVVSRESQFTCTTAGRAVYTGVKDIVVPITAKCSVAPVSGTNIKIGVYIAKNGVIVAASEAYGTASAGSPASITVIWQDGLSTNDYLEVFVENDDNATDLSVETAQFRIN